MNRNKAQHYLRISKIHNFSYASHVDIGTLFDFFLLYQYFCNPELSKDSLGQDREK